ncbi:MAG: hypothetical protein IJU29_03135 [Oscillospiraceae bacterium]|nr:hypothetical protein [Oscillospiraceae bacterium]
MGTAGNKIKRLFAGFYQKMNVICHETVCVSFEPGYLRALLQHREKPQKVFSLLEDVLTVDSPKHHMIDIGDADFSRASWHFLHPVGSYDGIIISSRKMKRGTVPLFQEKRGYRLSLILRIWIDEPASDPKSSDKAELQANEIDQDKVRMLHPCLRIPLTHLFFLYFFIEKRIFPPKKPKNRIRNPLCSQDFLFSGWNQARFVGCPPQKDRIYILS